MQPWQRRLGFPFAPAQHDVPAVVIPPPVLPPYVQLHPPDIAAPVPVEQVSPAPAQPFPGSPQREEDLESIWRRLTRSPALGRNALLTSTQTTERIADIALPYPDDFAVYIAFAGHTNPAGALTTFPFRVRVSAASGGSQVVTSYLLPATGLCLSLHTARATVDILVDPALAATLPLTPGDQFTFTCSIGRGVIATYHITDWWPTSTGDGNHTIEIPPFARRLTIQADDDSPTGAGAAGFQFLDAAGLVVWSLDPNGLGALPGLSPGRSVTVGIPRTAFTARTNAPTALASTTRVSFDWECYA